MRQRICPPLEQAREDAGVHTFQHCVEKRQNRVAMCVASRPIWPHCVCADANPDISDSRIVWWTGPGQGRPCPDTRRGEAHISPGNAVGLSLWQRLVQGWIGHVRACRQDGQFDSFNVHLACHSQVVPTQRWGQNGLGNKPIHTGGDLPNQNVCSKTPKGKLIFF